jgi:plasmid stability protein
LQCNHAARIDMASITIRKLDDRVKARLRLRAARHGRSMEEEAREIIAKAVIETRAPTSNLYDAIRKIVEPLGGIELELPLRVTGREPPRFDQDDDVGARHKRARRGRSA